MEWDTIKGVLAKLAPSIGAAVGGPLGGAAGAVISDVLGVDNTDDPAQVGAAIAGATPDQLLALKQADQQFQARMAELGFANAKDIEALNAADRKDARQREVSTGDWMPRALAITVTLGFFATLVALMYYGVPDKGGDALLVLLGALGSGWTAIIGYYYGSSAGSAAKDRLIKRAA